MLLSGMLVMAAFADDAPLPWALSVRNAAPVAPGQVIVAMIGPLGARRVWLEADGRRRGLGRPVVDTSAFHVYRVPKLPPGTYAVRVQPIKPDRGRVRGAGIVQVVASAPVEEPPRLVEANVQFTRQRELDDTDTWDVYDVAVLRVSSSPSEGSYFVEVTHELAGEPIIEGLRDIEGFQMEIHRVAGAEMEAVVCPTVVVRDGWWKELDRVLLPCASVP